MTLVDTDVVIWYFRGHPGAGAALENLDFALSAVTIMELAQGVRNKGELAALERFIAVHSIQIFPINEVISNRAVELVKSLFLGFGVQMADALIAATAVEHNLPLLTANARHFRSIGGLTVNVFAP